MEDILTLQEYLGYCLILTIRGPVMMLLKGNGGEGKNRIGVVIQNALGKRINGFWGIATLVAPPLL